MSDTPLTANDCETQTYYGYSCGIVATLTTRAEQAEADARGMKAAYAGCCIDRERYEARVAELTAELSDWKLRWTATIDPERARAAMEGQR